MQVLLPIHLMMTERRKIPMKKFWNWKNRTVTNEETQEQIQERTLFLNGTIAEESCRTTVLKSSAWNPCPLWTHSFPRTAL